MCGIVGIAGRHEPATVSRMARFIVHRGPDDYGEYADPEHGVALAVRRLSILDLVGGTQPMSNEDGTIHIVYNGEIYNAPDLRRQLEGRHRFKTVRSDTEVLLHLFEDRGDAMLDVLNGMFAFVIYDHKRQQLFGARDRLGIKPLYYVQGPGWLAIASEPKCFLALPEFVREVDPQSLFHYLSVLHVPGTGSIFRGVRRLAPGHRFQYDLRSGRLRIERYWDLEFSGVAHQSEAEWCGQIRGSLRDAVKRWMLSDVPVGFSLSGGTDSPAIVGLAAEAGFTHIKTYALGFGGTQEQAYSELPLARIVAQRWGTNHREFILDEETFLDDLVPMVWYLDEPYGGGLPSWYIFRLMREDVKVGLTGTGGDELFGNYGKFEAYEGGVAARVGSAWRVRLSGAGTWERAASKLVAGAAELIPAALVGTRYKRHLTTLATLLRRPLLDRYFRVHYYMADEVKHDVLAVDGSGIPTLELLEQLAARSSAHTVRDAIAYVDIKTQLADEFLLMTDRFSMAHSLEARVPFLDHTFVELMFRIPASVRMRRGDPKYLLKKAMADLLPEPLLHLPKRGFVIPNTLWLRGRLRPLVEHLLAPQRLAHQGILRPAIYDRIVRPHLDGAADFTWQVWPLLMFQLWYVIFIEEKSTDVPRFSWSDLC